MASQKWTPEEDQFLIENYPLLGVDKTAAALKRSNDAVVHRAIKLRARGHTVESPYNGKYPKWSKEEDEFIIGHYSKLGSKETIKEIKNRFGVQRTAKALSLHVHNLNKKLGIHICVDDECVSQINATNNKKESCPVGTIVYWQSPGGGNTKEAYIKTDGCPERHGWVMLKRYIMGEEADNKCVIFLNGDKSDYRKENLACVTSETNTRMKDWGFRSNDPEITKTGIMVCELVEAMKQQEKEN